MNSEREHVLMNMRTLFTANPEIDPMIPMIQPQNTSSATRGMMLGIAPSKIKHSTHPKHVGSDVGPKFHMSCLSGLTDKSSGVLQSVVAIFREDASQMYSGQGRRRFQGRRHFQRDGSWSHHVFIKVGTS